MPIGQFITSVFCLIDDLYISLVTQPLRKRGTPPLAVLRGRIYRKALLCGMPFNA